MGKKEAGAAASGMAVSSISGDGGLAGGGRDWRRSRWASSTSSHTELPGPHSLTHAASSMTPPQSNGPSSAVAGGWTWGATSSASGAAAEEGIEEAEVVAAPP